MSEERRRHTPIHLSEEELLSKLPAQIGKVKLDYQFYPGKDLYSDGEIEDKILSIVKNAAHVEYPSIIEESGSWPILYHLSSLRGNIVDWLPIKSTDKVLEIGSGCGVITEKLAEKAKSVTCVDLSAKRSRINAYRNQDKDNIEIHVGNFSDIEPSLEEDYDFACMIGVFEYGQSYIHTKTPYEDFLKIMMKHVKKEGCIVIAIENKFGLKYWAGCQEDHAGAYFCGLEGYPEGGSARTFTRPGLEKIFKNCGVENYSFYYPYPDYKFPTVIYSDRRLPHQGELTDNIRNFDRDRMVLFNEKYVFDGTIQDGLFDVFSNSYLVMIGGEANTCYVKYSNDRAGKYALRTDIVDTPDGRVVRKIPMNEQAAGHIRGMKQAYELLKDRYEGSGLSINACQITKEGYAQFPYEKGVTLEELLDECLERDDMEEFHRLFDRYYELVSYGNDKPVTDYDLIFANILVDGDKWTVIDYEWTMKRQIPPQEIAFRAVYCYVLEEEKRNRLDLDAIMRKLGITEKMADSYRRKEAKFQKQVTGKRMSMGEIRSLIGTYCIEPKTLMEYHLKKILDERIQIYFDNGKGFQEENSYYMPDVYEDESLVCAQIPFDGNVKTLRIDPADCSCMVKILKLDLNGADVPFQKKFIQTNGKMVKPGCYVFDTQDPNLCIMVSELAMDVENELTIEMEVSPVPKDMAQDMMGAVKKVF
ncbi:ubiquinone biosynthesis O-methyltransferase [Lachnospiraceae bacterium]|jgi:2-polyprenyl-3-methyl-5-hydroxy-6-metoxy-1,4-benzoquinol methylase|nr:class I SAM-dependent methyltransferase [Lachnospiraceae bacterium]GFI70572.1 ubiquinone biosynthesis O-methyltransferase [Lachnospiraceae bacterium]